MKICSSGVPSAAKRASRHRYSEPASFPLTLLFAIGLVLVSGQFGLAQDTTPTKPAETQRPVSVTILTTNAADMGGPGFNQTGPTQGEWSF